MPDDTKMILFLNADQQEALYDLQVSLHENRDSLYVDFDINEHARQLDKAIELYGRVMRPTYKPEEN